MPPIACPLQDKDCEALNGIMERCSQRLQLLEIYDKLGLEVSELTADNKQMLDFCRSVKAQFFPERV
jgi:hypothetical protein